MELRLRAAVILLGLVGVPASAHPPGMTVGAPNGHVHQHFSHGDVAAGLTCGLATSHGGSRKELSRVQIDFAPIGAVECGPIAFGNTGGGTISNVTVCAELQVDNPFPGIPDVRECMSAAGNIGLLAPRLVAFDVTASDAAYVCTWLSWTGSNGSFAEYVDVDQAAPGTQCALASEVHPT